LSCLLEPLWPQTHIHGNVNYAYRHTYIPTDLPTYLPPYIHTYMNCYIHTYALHYTTLHYSTLHYTTLHYITLHYTTLHYTTRHNIALHCIRGVQEQNRTTQGCHLNRMRCAVHWEGGDLSHAWCTVDLLSQFC